MIYAIRALGTEFVKIGKANSVGKRLKELETGCPHELHIEAVADWPDEQEKAIHSYLESHLQKLEWFKDGEITTQVIEWMRDGERGLREFRVAFLEHAKSRHFERMPKWLMKGYTYPSQIQPSHWIPVYKRRANPGNTVAEKAPEIPMQPAQGTNDRYERIKQRALERRARKEVQRSPETA